MARATGAAEWAARAALLTPIAKAFGTDTGARVADMAVQVHGGSGYIEQTGVAQYLRDVRITAIYEGTNGIQAMDLVGRKLADGGAAALALVAEVEAAAQAALAMAPDLARPVAAAAADLRGAIATLVALPEAERFAGAAPFLHAFALVLGAGAHLRAARADAARLPLARVMVTRLLPEHAALLAVAGQGGEDLRAVTTASLGG